MIGKREDDEMKTQKVSWFSIPGLSILLIFLNALLPMTAILAIQVVVLMFILKRIRINYAFAIPLILIFFQSYIAMMFGTGTYIRFLQQFISIAISMTYWVTVVNRKNIPQYLILYKQMAVFTAAVAILQHIASILGINSLATMSWLIIDQNGTPAGRSAAFLNEPSYCALVLFPIVFLGFYQIFGRYRRNKLIIIRPWEFITVVLGFFFTGSSSGFIGLVFAVFVIVFEYKFTYKQFLALALAILCFGGVYTRVPFVHERVNDSISLVNGENTVKKVNLSSQSLAINQGIAFDSFRDTHGLGGGLGSHSVSYDKYIGQYGNNIFRLNNYDANSLLLRIISEQGMVGIIILLTFLIGWRFRRTKNPSQLCYDAISKMCLCYFCIRLLRFGHYFDCGLYMFVVMYYRCYIASISDHLKVEHRKIDNA